MVVFFVFLELIFISWLVTYCLRSFNLFCNFEFWNLGGQDKSMSVVICEQPLTLDYASELSVKINNFTKG